MLFDFHHLRDRKYLNFVIGSLRLGCEIRGIFATLGDGRGED
jgi:hypothetical protein